MTLPFGNRRVSGPSWKGMAHTMPPTTRYKWGDVVLVLFPLTDVSGTQRRPGLVLFDSGDEDVVLARITTQEARHLTDVRLPGWKGSGLIAESVVRLSKVATVKKSLVERRLGTLAVKDSAVVQRIWTRMFPAPR